MWCFFLFVVVGNSQISLLSLKTLYYRTWTFLSIKWKRTS